MSEGKGVDFVTGGYAERVTRPKHNTGGRPGSHQDEVLTLISASARFPTKAPSEELCEKQLADVAKNINRMVPPSFLPSCEEEAGDWVDFVAAMVKNMTLAPPLSTITGS